MLLMKSSAAAFICSIPEVLDQGFRVFMKMTFRSRVICGSFPGPLAVVCFSSSGVLHDSFAV